MKKYLPILISFLFLVTAVYLNLQHLNKIFSDNRMWISAAIVFLLTIFLVLSIFNVINYKQRKRLKTMSDRLSMWTQLSYHVNQVGDEVFNELPIGILAFDDNQEIKWANPHAKILFRNKIINKQLSEVDENLSLVFTSGEPFSTISIGEDLFDVIYKKELNFMYLFNVTDREIVKKKAYEQIPALGIIYLDNLDESLSSLDVSVQTSLKGSYLAAISDWVEKYEGYLKPYGDGRLVLFTTRKHLEKMIEDKFEILDIVRNVSMANNVRVTLSIGIASWDVAFSELGVFAQNAVELAEKRGGDQVVVNIQNKKIAYFGAKTDASEKNSKVSARINAQTITQFIEHASNVLIMGHDKSDLDAFGSMLAMYHISKAIKPQTFMVYDVEKLDTTVSKVESMLQAQHADVLKDALNTEAALKKMTGDSLVIVLDTQSPKMVISREVLEKSKKTIIIDHHRASEEGFDAVFSSIEPYASSTIELVMELLSFSESTPIKPIEASIMYGGLVLDTNSFTKRTGTRTFEIAQKLKEFGAEPSLVKTWLRKDLIRTLEINRLLSQIEIYKDSYAFIVSKDIYDDRVLLAQVSEEALSISGIDAAFTIAPMAEGIIGVSARSFEKINVQILMEAIGGGGHLSSAAAQVKDLSLEEVYEKIKHYIDLEYGKEGDGNMKVILLEDVKGRGKKDDIIEVANGYGQFLLTQKKAVLANEEQLEILNQAKQKALEEQRQHLELMKKLKSEIDGKNVRLTIQTGQDGKAFGSITTKKIVEAFEEQHEIHLDKKKVELSSEINSVGIYTATVYLHKDVKAQFEIHIVEK